MATEILVNDGGAPARILPYTAGSTISAGYPVTIATDGEVDQLATSGSLILGFSLTAATSGNICNVISGHGVLLNVAASSSASNIVIGTNLGTSTQDGALCAMPATADGNANTVAIALATGTASVGLLKVQVV